MMDEHHRGAMYDMVIRLFIGANRWMLLDVFKISGNLSTPYE